MQARSSLQPVAAQHNLSVPDATLDAMRIRTIDGPPLPAEIAEMTARAIALTEVLSGDLGGRSAASYRRDMSTAQGLSPDGFGLREQERQRGRGHTVL